MKANHAPKPQKSKAVGFKVVTVDVGRKKMTFRIPCGDDPETIREWREERRRNWPSRRRLEEKRGEGGNCKAYFNGRCEGRCGLRHNEGAKEEYRGRVQEEEKNRKLRFQKLREKYGDRVDEMGAIEELFKERAIECFKYLRSVGFLQRSHDQIEAKEQSKGDKSDQNTKSDGEKSGNGDTK